MQQKVGVEGKIIIETILDYSSVNHILQQDRKIGENGRENYQKNI